MTGYHIIFDRDNLKLGWSRSDCKLLRLFHFIITFFSLRYIFLYYDSQR
jgi:hypothetical protein